MSLSITVTFADSVNGSTSDAFSLNDADAATFLSVLATANAPGGQRRGQQPPQAVTPLTYDALYHQIANNFWLGLQARVQHIQMQAAQSAAMETAQSGVRVISASAAAHTTPTVKSVA